ncbi:MAG: glycosyltransferase, partial [Bacteroidota bacterium]|nr:glycosyltransferase [Bacteroidota bacterium]
MYLETPEKLSKYISRLHNLSGDRPLLLAEIGLDSLRNGEEKQAEVLKWQIETIFGKGCAGMFIFAWTDEWWRGGYDIEDWDFGIVDRQRQPKLALITVAETMQHVPFFTDNFPFISVVVCSYNGSATIRDTMEGLQKLDYPNFEVVVVNDGSTDNLVEIIKEYPVRLYTTSNKGLSSARNTGMYKARGEILAYIDDDAYPDPHWLHYLAYAYMNTTHAAMGGPNICPDEDGPIATCVANAPGGPVHVLVTDEIAEHIPGCNLSVRRNVLMKIGGFDPVYRSAGDDVDVCWRIQEEGYTIGYHPSALVWHHRRNSLKAYWKQQKGYGKAEALLEAKWPEKYNGFGHLKWDGRIYGNGLTLPLKIKKDKIFHGTWGSGLFQSVYQPASGFLNSIPLMPEWYFISILFAVVASLGFLWKPLL